MLSIGDTASFKYEAYDKNPRNVYGKGFITSKSTGFSKPRVIYYRAVRAVRSKKKFKGRAFLDCDIFEVKSSARVVLTEKALKIWRV